MDSSAKKDLPQIQVGDVVFIRIPALLFRKVADASASWTNHVGIVIGHDGYDWVVAESCVPCVRKQRFGTFIARSDGGRFVLRRLPSPWSASETSALVYAVNRRLGALYHTGFALRSKRQFCSKFVHEVIAEARDEHIGEVETFRSLLGRQPGMRIGFWRLWFFGRIPWQRETITPDSQLRSTKMKTVFAGQ